MHSNLVDTRESLVAFLDSIGDCVGQPPTLYVDLEGNDLSRHGTLSLVTILVQPQDRIYLVDVTTLKDDAFTTATSTGRTLKDILEAEDIVKVFFDIRNDSDALFSLYEVRVQGIEDLQLMELAGRNFNKKCVNGLAKCIENDCPVSFHDREEWLRVKGKSRTLFDPAQGGSFSVFDKRPLSTTLQEYCAQDVQFMPLLRSVYVGRLCDAWWTKICEETKKRILLSQSPGFNGKGRHMALGPAGWLHWTPTATERGVRTRVEALNPKIVSKDTTHIQPELVGESSATRDTSPSGLITAMQELDVTEGRALAFVDSDEESYGGGTCIGDDDSDSRDFTACDIECGYCGKCDY